MRYSVINYNYSDDAEGLFEDNALKSFLNPQPNSSAFAHNLTFKLTELLARFNLEPGYESQTTTEYLKACDQMIDFCKTYTNFLFYGDLQAYKISFLCLKIRIEEVKQKVLAGSSLKDAMEPYKLCDRISPQRYQNPTLFKDNQASVNQKACEQVNAVLAKSHATTSDFKLASYAIGLNWLINWSNPTDKNFCNAIVNILLASFHNKIKNDSWDSIDKKLDQTLLTYILPNEKLIEKFCSGNKFYSANVLRNFYNLLHARGIDLTTFLTNNTSCLTMLITKSPTAFLVLLSRLETGTKLDDIIVEIIFTNEDLVSKFRLEQVLRWLLGQLIMMRTVKLDSYFLSNINSLDVLAKISPELFVYMVQTVKSKAFFRLALQKGFNFQHCLVYLKANFETLRSELTLVLYETLSRGIITIATDLVEFSNSYKIEKNKVKTTSTPLTMFAASSQQTVTTQQLTSYDDSVIAFSFEHLLEYLKEKFQQISQQTELNLTPKETLHFIKRPKAFMQSLVRLQLISKENSKEFTMAFCTEFNIPPNEVLEHEERKVIEVPDLLKMLATMQNQIQELQAEMLKMEAKHAAEIKELKERIEQCESYPDMSNRHAP